MLLKGEFIGLLIGWKGNKEVNFVPVSEFVIFWMFTKYQWDRIQEK